MLLSTFLGILYQRLWQPRYKRLKFRLSVHETSCLAALDIIQLETYNIRGIILDLDNTIISEDDRYLSPGAESWIEDAKRIGMKLFILSNGKRRCRVEQWSNRLSVPAIGRARKPFPFSFVKALHLMQLSPWEVVVIGDSRHTDILGAWLVGCPSIQVATLPHPLHWWEKLLGKRVQNPCPLKLLE